MYLAGFVNIAGWLIHKTAPLPGFLKELCALAHIRSEIRFCELPRALGARSKLKPAHVIAAAGTLHVVREG